MTDENVAAVLALVGYLLYSVLPCKSVMKEHLTVGVVAMITLSVFTALTPPTYSKFVNEDTYNRKAPPAITGDNVYVAWWTNDTANYNNEVIFRASTDGGETFGDKINLSNTTDADSTRVEIDSDADSVVVTWWETNQTDDTPVMRVSDDNGETFGPLLTLVTNGTLGEAAEGEDEG